MRKSLIVAALGAGLGTLMVTNHFRPRKTPVSVELVKTGPLTVVTTYEGVIQSRRIESIASRFSGKATVAWIVPEGTHVEKSDVLVRFERSTIERELFKLEREFVLAESELESLEHARLPLELRDLEITAMETRTAYETEKQYLADTIELAKENLVSDGQVKRQKLKVKKLEERLKGIELKLELTEKHLHPAALRRAKTNLATAKQALDQAGDQLSNTVVRAPAGGAVVYKPLHIGTEFRPARIGDSIYENQPFMIIPDMSNLVVDCHVPEAELSRVQTGANAAITPLAYPDMELSGRIERVSSMAQPLSWMPAWQKYFHIVIALEGNDPKLRTGMSAHVHIFSYHNANAVLVPRIAVLWRTNTPYCKVMRKDGNREIRQLVVGKADETHYEVLAGLKPGEKVVTE